MKATFVFVLAFAIFPAVAHAQSWTQITPGHSPSFGYTGPSGNTTIITPGQPPTFINPTYGGGATIITPGQPPSFIYQQPGYTPPQPMLPANNPYLNPYQR
jgi:hypothetical protein